MCVMTGFGPPGGRGFPALLDVKRLLGEKFQLMNVYDGHSYDNCAI